MKKKQLLIVTICLLIGLNIKLSAQQHLMTLKLEKSKNSKEYYIVSDKTPGTGMKGTKGFFIRKVDRNSGKDLFNVFLEIPNHSVMRFPITNQASFNLVEENIVAVYDVKQKSFKNCFIQNVSTNTGKLGEKTLVFSENIKSVFDFHKVASKTVLSPDLSKVAILKDNMTPELNINTEVYIYDAKTLKLISSRNLGQKYNNIKRVFDLTKINMDNNSNIDVIFNLINEKTNITTKTYSANLPANASELQGIKELNENALADGASLTSHGRFYKNIKDFLDDKPIEGVRIKNGSYSYSVVKGNEFKLIDDEGNLKSEDAKNLPSDIFTYKRDNYIEPLLMRIINKKPYIVLAVGKFSYYALYLDNQLQYYTEDWDSSDLKSFKEKFLKRYLKQYGLLEEYENTMPKREMKDNVNSWFNKNVKHNIEYIIKLNKIMNK